MITTAKLRNRAAIHVPIRTRTVQGGFAVAWAFLREVYCQIQPVSAPGDPDGGWRSRTTGHERNFAGKTRSDVSHRLTMRAQPEWLTTDMRLVEAIKQNNNPYYRVFNIIEAIEIENIQNEMKIDVKENLSDLDNATAAYNVVFDASGNAVTDTKREYVAA